MALRSNPFKIEPQAIGWTKLLLRNSKPLHNSKTESKTTTRNPTTAQVGRPPMFSFAMFRKHYEVVPLLAIVGAGVCGLAYWGVRVASTRDDVRFKPLSADAIGDQSIKTFLYSNQLYEVPTALVTALQALQDPNKAQKQK